MSEWHGDLHKRKLSGGRKRSYRGKRRFERGSFPTETTLGERKNKVDRRRGGNLKVRLYNTQWVNVSDPSTGETNKVEIQKVIKTPANIDYNRRKIITKGTILDTSLGQAVVTSRPGQSGILNAIIISKLKK
jgi:small subunit ribosomal protein S8e